MSIMNKEMSKNLILMNTFMKKLTSEKRLKQSPPPKPYHPTIGAVKHEPKRLPDKNDPADCRSSHPTVVETKMKSV